MPKKKVIIILALLSVFMLTGCFGSVWNVMKDEGKKLLEQGQELNQQLESEARDVNSSWMSK